MPKQAWEVGIITGASVFLRTAAVHSTHTKNTNDEEKTLFIFASGRSPILGLLAEFFADIQTTS